MTYLEMYRKAAQGLITIETPTGKIVNVNLDNNTVNIPDTGLTGELTDSRAYPVPASTPDDIIKSGATHFVQHNVDGQRAVVFLDAKNAEILNDALKANALDKIKSQREQLAAAIPGLNKLYQAINAENEYEHAFDLMMEDEQNDGANAPSHPATDVRDIAAKYPKAALYVRAENYSLAANYHKSSAGNKAMEILINGGSMDEVSEILENWLPESAQWD